MWRLIANIFAAMAVVLFLATIIVCIHAQSGHRALMRKDGSRSIVVCNATRGFYVLVVIGSAAPSQPGWEWIVGDTSFAHQAPISEFFNEPRQVNVLDIIVASYSVLPPNKTSDQVEVHVPYWLILLATGFVVTVWCVTRYYRNREPADPMICSSCGYDLRGSAAGAACPECGAARIGAVCNPEPPSLQSPASFRPDP